MITIQLWLAVCILYDHLKAMTCCLYTVWLPYSYDSLFAYSMITIQHYDSLSAYSMITIHYNSLSAYSMITIQLWLVCILYDHHKAMTCCLYTVWLPYSYDCLHTARLPYSIMTCCLHTVWLPYTVTRCLLTVWLPYTITHCLHTVWLPNSSMTYCTVHNAIS